MHKVAGPILSAAHAAEIAGQVLTQRIQAVHHHLAPGDHLRVGLFVRRAPPFELGTALTLNWFPRFTGKEAPPDVWRDRLLPSLSHIADAIRQHAPGREVEAFGIPTLPAALALGCAFLSTSGIKLFWQQLTPGHPDQFWTLSAARDDSQFQHRIWSKDPTARDIAVLVSVADDTEPLFAACQRRLPPLRALVHVRCAGSYPHQIKSAGEAADIAFAVQDGMRTARRDYGNIGTVHLFMAAPAGLAVLVGQLLNTFGAIQTYEHVVSDGSGHYKPAALLHPCS